MYESQLCNEVNVRIMQRRFDAGSTRSVDSCTSPLHFRMESLHLKSPSRYISSISNYPPNQQDRQEIHDASN